MLREELSWIGCRGCEPWRSILERQINKPGTDSDLAAGERVFTSVMDTPEILEEARCNRLFRVLRGNGAAKVWLGAGQAKPAMPYQLRLRSSRDD